MTEPPPDLQALRTLAARAVFGSFALLAISDGDLDDDEISTFLSALEALQDPLLLELMALLPEPPQETLAKLWADSTGTKDSLRAAGQVFAIDPRGPAAKAALMDLLNHVARADGDVGSSELRVLEAIEDLLNTPTPPPTPISGAGALLLVGLGVTLLASWLLFG